MASVRNLAATVLLGSSLLAKTAFADPNDPSLYEERTFFLSYVAQFDKQYLTVAEFRMRLELFIKTQETIRDHNARIATTIDSDSFVLGNNYFSDLTLAEKRLFFGYSHPLYDEDERDKKYEDLPPNYDNWKDWRAEGAVGPIRNEGGVC